LDIQENVGFMPVWEVWEGVTFSNSVWSFLNTVACVAKVWPTCIISTGDLSFELS